MITRPLDFESRLSPPPRDLDFVAWVNVAVIVLFFALLGSRFILSPGVEMQLGGGKSVLDLPSAGSAANGSAAASVVVTYRRDNVILFEGAIYSLPDLQKRVRAYAKANPGAVMLVRIDRQVTMQAFLDFAEMVKKEGFGRVVVASEPREEADVAN
ncbi:ExbD/TolR family protein [Oleiharenicola lentus]|uniref:ExbD/TolR family protein n=1 Tax=Oleiharenicola lentus TaxID=2508720 RepID=UPI003F66537E